MDSIDPNHVCHNNSWMLESISGSRHGESNPFFPLSVRAMNLLQSENIYYIGSLVVMKKKQLLEIPGMGEKTFEEIDQALKSKRLSLGVPCSKRLSTLDDIRIFYSIDTPDTPKQSIGRLFVNVSLPSALIEGKTDADVIEAIQSSCQQAFVAAVIAKSIGGARVASPPEHIPFPSGEIRQVKVPLDCTEKTAQNPHSIKIAQDISGVILYPLLKADLE